MGFGQYSTSGGMNRTKGDMMDACGVADATWSRKAGKNRVHFKLADGSQGFILHETIIARLSASRETLTLADGGWPSLTTRAAFSEAASAFGLPELRASGARPHASHSLGFYSAGAWTWNQIRFDREVAIKVTPQGYEALAGAKAPPSIRAILNDGDGTCMVTYERRAFRSEADGGITIAATPKRALQLLHHVLRIAARGKGRIAMHREPLYERGEVVAGYHIVPASMGRSVQIGCHAFRVEDLRGMLNHLERDNPADAPEIAKEARKLARADKIATDKAVEAERAAWLERHRANERAKAASRKESASHA